MIGKILPMKILKILLPYIVLLLIIVIWEVVALSGLFLSALFPSPTAVARALLEVAQDGVLLTHIGASLFRVFVGFFLAAVVAIPFGFLLGQFSIVSHALNPPIQTLRHISPIAWIPLAILWFGIGNKSAIFIIWITSFFPILLASVSAVRNIDPVIIKSAVNLGASNKDILQKVVLPATFPQVFVGLRIALGIAWIIIVAAEMVGMRSGLGFMILDARNFLRIDIVIAGMVVVGIIGYIIDRVMVRTEDTIRRKWGYVTET